MHVKLTDARIHELKPAAEGKRYDVHDTVQHGLIIRVAESGPKSFILRTRVPGHKHFTRRVIGSIDKVSLAGARETAGPMAERPGSCHRDA
jgi:hypothetical protein